MTIAARALLQLTAVAALLSMVAACGATNLVQQQRLYNQQTCQQYGLIPGTGAYIECISDGADVYAQSHSVHAAAPFRPWGPVPRNSSCNAPASPSGSCASCSVTCVSGQQATCQQGQEWPGGSPTCMREAQCSCK